MTSNAILKVSTRSLLIAIILMAVAIIPALAFAATYAYVNQTGEVRTVVADNPMTAIMIAPSIDEHSGVMLLMSPTDGVVGDAVPGV